MRKKTLPVYLIALFMGAHAALAGAENANGHDLLQRCNAFEKSIDGQPLRPEETLDAMWCMGYVSGLLDGFGVSDYRIGDAIAACPGETTLNRTQAVKIINQWLRQHPDDLEKSGRRNAILAISKAFPCQAR